MQLETMFGIQNRIVQTRNVLTSLIWVLAIVAFTTATMSHFSADQWLKRAMFILLSVCVGSVLVAFFYFALRRPELLLSENTQVQQILTQTFGQSTQNDREAAKIISAIRQDPTLSLPTDNRHIKAKPPNSPKQIEGRQSAP